MNSHSTHNSDNADAHTVDDVSVYFCLLKRQVHFSPGLVNRDVDDTARSGGGGYLHDEGSGRVGRVGRVWLRRYWAI